MSAAPVPTAPATASAGSLTDITSEERYRLAARTLGDALLLGIVGDALLRVPTWGANMTLWSLAIVVAMVTLARRRLDTLPPDARWLLVPVLALAVLFTWRDTESLTVYNTLTLLGTLALLAAAIEGGSPVTIRESRVRDLVHSGVTVGLSAMFGMLPLVLSDVSLRQVAGSRGTSRAIAGLRAALVAIPLLLVFGGLFASADPVFAKIVADIFRIDAATVASHLALTGFIAWVVGGLLRAAVLSNGRMWRTVPFPDGALGLTEVSVALGSLVLLFAAFVAVQLRYFFGGDALVQATAGMSYADYARRGFFELVTVATLVLPVLLAANALLRRETPRADRVYRGLAGALIGLLSVIMYSAVRRMELYVSAYGLTIDRLDATVFIAWLAIVFAWFAGTVLRGREKPFVSGVLVSGWVTLIALNVGDPAGYVARFNIDRANQGKEVDVRYISFLGADAAPDLVRYLVRDRVAVPAGWVIAGQDSTASAALMPNAFPMATADAPESADFGERCEAARRLLRNFAPETSTDWRSWSVARARARRAVAANQSALRRLAGPLQIEGKPIGCPTQAPTPATR
jgi:hypothetical protein